MPCIITCVTFATTCDLFKPQSLLWLMNMHKPYASQTFFSRDTSEGITNFLKTIKVKTKQSKCHKSLKFITVPTCHTSTLHFKVFEDPVFIFIFSPSSSDLNLAGERYFIHNKGDLLPCQSSLSYIWDRDRLLIQTVSNCCKLAAVIHNSGWKWQG